MTDQVHNAEIKMSATKADLQARFLRVLRDPVGGRSLLGQSVGEDRQMASSRGSNHEVPSHENLPVPVAIDSLSQDSKGCRVLGRFLCEDTVQDQRQLHDGSRNAQDCMMARGMRKPSDVSGPEAHMSCRCVVCYLYRLPCWSRRRCPRGVLNGKPITFTIHPKIVTPIVGEVLCGAPPIHLLINMTNDPIEMVFQSLELRKARVVSFFNLQLRRPTSMYHRLELDGMDRLGPMFPWMKCRGGSSQIREISWCVMSS